MQRQRVNQILRKSHRKTVPPREQSHLHTPKQASITDAKKCLMTGARYSCSLRGYARLWSITLTQQWAVWHHSGVMWHHSTVFCHHTGACDTTVEHCDNTVEYGDTTVDRSNEDCSISLCWFFKSIIFYKIWMLVSVSVSIKAYAEFLLPLWDIKKRNLTFNGIYVSAPLPCSSLRGRGGANVKYEGLEEVLWDSAF